MRCLSIKEHTGCKIQNIIGANSPSSVFPGNMNTKCIKASESFKKEVGTWVTYSWLPITHPHRASLQTTLDMASPPLKSDRKCARVCVCARARECVEFAGFRVGEKNVVISCWQHIQWGDYWTVTQRQMSDECLLTCFLHLVGREVDEFRPGDLVLPNRGGQ